MISRVYPSLIKNGYSSKIEVCIYEKNIQMPVNKMIYPQVRNAELY